MIIRICRNSLRPLTGRGTMHVQRKGTVLTKGKISFSFSSDQRSDNTMLTGGGHQCII